MQGGDVSIWSQIFSFQTLIAATVSGIITVVGFYIKEHIDKRGSRRKYILDNGYVIHERLRDNLRDFLKEEPIFKYADVPSKASESLKNRAKASYQTYKVESKKDLFSALNEITLYSAAFDDFEKRLIPDIRKVSKLSIPPVQAIADKIEALFLDSKGDEQFFGELMQEELDPGYELTKYSASQKAYIEYKQEIYKQLFWIEMYPLLLKLQTKIERVVKLQL
jgi:hypothetical protein